MAIVQLAAFADIPSWLDLAAEVEPLFGPMVDVPEFSAALQKNIRRGSAFCIREQDGPPETPLVAGLLFSAHPPAYRIGWLAVAQRARRQGHASLLLHHVLGLVTPPATISVVTFGPDSVAGLPARRLYETFGFAPAEAVAPGPEGGSRQVFRREMAASDEMTSR